MSPEASTPGTGGGRSVPLLVSAESEKRTLFSLRGTGGLLLVERLRCPDGRARHHLFFAAGLRGSMEEVRALCASARAPRRRPAVRRSVPRRGRRVLLRRAAPRPSARVASSAGGRLRHRARRVARLEERVDLAQREPVAHAVFPAERLDPDEARLECRDDLRVRHRALIAVGDVDRPALVA